VGSPVLKVLRQKGGIKSLGCEAAVPALEVSRKFEWGRGAHVRSAETRAGLRSGGGAYGNQRRSRSDQKKDSRLVSRVIGKAKKKKKT